MTFNFSRMCAATDTSGAPSALGMSTVHRRMDPSFQETQQAKRRRIMNSNVDEDNKKRLRDLIGYKYHDTVRQVRRIDCSTMSKGNPEDPDVPERPQKTEPSEKVEPTEKVEPAETEVVEVNDNQSLEEPTYEREVDTGFVVRDQKISSKIQRVRVKKKDPKKEEEWVPQNEIEVAVRDLLKYDQLPSPEMQPEIIEHVKYESAQAVLNKDYDRAAQLEAVYHLVNDGLEWQANEQMRLEAKEALEERIQEARGRLEEEQQKWERILDEFYEQQKAERQEMLAGQEEEMTEFEEKWADESRMIRYSKPTPELISLRKTEKFMAMLKQFEDAKMICQRADELQEGLTAEAEGRAIVDMIKQHGTLLEKHRREVECFDEHERRIEQYLKGEREKVLGPIEKQIEQLQNRKNQDAPTNMKPTVTQAYVSTTRTRTCRTAKAIPKRTEETTRAIAEFRNRHEIPKLAVRALDVRRIIGKNGGTNGSTRVVSVLQRGRRAAR